MELKIYIRQSAVYNKNGELIYYSGSNPLTLQPVKGEIPQGNSRRWANYLNYIDVTADAGDLFNMSLEWSTSIDERGEFTPGEFQQQKNASGTISFINDTFRLLKAWLLDDVSSGLNSVDVKIEHVGCGSYENYIITAKDIHWCGTDICQFDCSIQQKDEPLNCIRRTVISDNWQGMFQKVPANGKKHPRFSYCNEERPNGKLVFRWYIAITMFSTMGMSIFGLALAINPILVILQAIENVLNSIPGVNVDWNIPAPINADNIYDGFGSFMVEDAGCGRLHPAPLVRDYISNVCDKCGIKVDSTSAPIFYSQTFNNTVSEPSLGVINVPNPHYDACYLSATVKRGIRRFKKLGLKALAGYSDKNTTDYYIPENAPIRTLDQFLDELKSLYNAEWRIQSSYNAGKLEPKLYFQRKDAFVSSSLSNPVYDFASADVGKILEGVCLESADRKTPAVIRGIYQDDNVDSCGKEATSRMNDIISIGNIDTNPNYEGILAKDSKFSATRFRFDGVSGDYIYDAMQVISNGGIVTLLSVGAFMPWILALWFKTIQEVLEVIDDYAAYALLLSDETHEKPKILLWNGESFDDARCHGMYNCHGLNQPNTNFIYNPDNVNWENKKNPEVDVIGNDVKGSSGNEYIVKDYLNRHLASHQAVLVNYPMYFESGYKDSLFDWFHFIDDPRRYPVLNQTWSVKIKLCCDDLKKLGVFGDASQILLGEKVKLPIYFNNLGTITSIAVNYNPTNGIGQYIELKGFV